MITFRYHLVSIAAVLIALAAGIALGAGVLDESRVAPDGDDTGSGTDAALSTFLDGYASRTSSGLIDGTLDNRSVVVMTLPGAREDEVSGITRNLEKAGASVTGTVEISGKLLDPANRQFAESVASESAPSVDGSGYGLVGEALARSVLGGNGKALNDDARTIASAFDEGGLASATEAPKNFASLAVVVAGPSRVGDSAEVLTGLIRAIDATGTAALVAGPSSASREGGAVDAVRSDAAQVSSIDVTDTGAGRAVAALALARAAAGETGAWGTSRSADGPVPQ